MRILVWQWGRRGAGPRLAAAMADAMRMVPGTEALLSLSTGAEILRSRMAPACDLPFDTYGSSWGFLNRLVQTPLIVRRLSRRLAALRPDVGVCALPALLDLLMMLALRRNRAPMVVVVHDADLHPGDGRPAQMFLQRRLMRRADAVIALSHHVASRLREQHLVDAEKLFVLFLPPFVFGPLPPPPLTHGGPVRLLFFGRLLQYKGLDLLAAAVRALRTRDPWELRIVGSGPECEELATLRGLPGVTVENRWVPEDEIGELIAWSDAIVLPYREASQSGVAPAAIAAGRYVISTHVGGLAEQLCHSPMATLCEPNVGCLTAALRDFIDAPPEARSAIVPVDPRLAWRDMAQQLLAKVPGHADPHHRHS